MEWTFSWVSSFGSDFNADFSVGFSPEEQQREGGITYNYRREYALVDRARFLRERPGVSAFALEDHLVYHAYSTYARGLDLLWGMLQWLDRAPTGRTEKGHW